MPRNGSGTSSVVNTFVIDTIADPDEVNANFTDVADQLTNSLPRDGQAGMNAPLPLQNGTAALPALTFTSDPDTGVYRDGANGVGIAAGGSRIASFQDTTIIGDFVRGFLYALTLSNNVSDATNDIDIAVGSAASDTSPYALMTLASTLTKRLDAAWAVGSGNGGWLDGASMPDGTGHAFLIQRSDTGVVDVGFSASLSPTLPTDYDRKRRIGSILRSGAILGFTQRGDTFKLTNLQLLFSSAAFGNAALTISGAGPAGISVEAIVNINLLSASGNTCYISDLTSADLAPSAQVATVGGTATNISGNGRVFTSTSRTFRARCAVGSATETINVSLVGWVDTRGRV